LAWSSWIQRTPAGLPLGMPGIGDEMDGAVQQAPQSGRQEILCALTPGPHLICLLKTCVMCFLQTCRIYNNADLTEGQILLAIAVRTAKFQHADRPFLTLPRLPLTLLTLKSVISQ
jgi:hypothetical protein